MTMYLILTDTCNYWKDWSRLITSDHLYRLNTIVEHDVAGFGMWFNFCHVISLNSFSQDTCKLFAELLLTKDTQTH